MVTMKDVARASGVSMITVSRVINNPELVAEATRLKVEQAMGELGFLPNHAAKALAENNTRTIHLYVPRFMGLSEPFMMNLIAGVSEELKIGRASCRERV
jgi:DNA-binding LacI/PurR family transcriptional regulator